MTRTLPDWLSHLEALHPKPIDLGLDRVSQVAYRLGVRRLRCPVITVGGTNGKGSTVAFLSSIYEQAGYQVGAYTSPHLLRFNERICINGQAVSDDALCEAFQTVENARGQITLTYFEAVTLAAFYLFAKVQLDVVILEVGLGGRLDAVNCVDADVSVITTISLDHTDFLGPSRDSIAFEKAGIFRSRKPAICGDLTPPEKLLSFAKMLDTPLCLSGRDFGYEELEHQWSWKQGETFYSNLPKPHLPLQNAATSLAVVEVLQNKLPISQEAIKEGLKTASLPGRFQIVQNSPKVVVDVAHNPGSGSYLAWRLQRESSLGKTYAVVAMLEDKDQENTVLPLLPLIQAWFVAPLFIPRGSSGQRLYHFLQTASSNTTLCASVLDAYSKVLNRADANDRIVIFGSFHTVSEVLQARF